ncbi:hypothetical protein, partial [Cellulomonas chitinilytica]|uniref:hypothetical protein n=1 Tax=Cellulomonas chitinilytica TaxID=398759 RepID=UPI0019413ABC
MDASPITPRAGERTPQTRRERRQAEELAITQRGRAAAGSPVPDQTATAVLPAVAAPPRGPADVGDADVGGADVVPDGHEAADGHEGAGAREGDGAREG